jgi:hypothetical protein
VPRIYKTNHAVFDNVTLMPYLMVIGTEKFTWNGEVWDRDILGRGYIDAETFEIVIPAQYEQAGDFVGNFAVVQKKKNGRKMIINKENEIILRGFDVASLYPSEDGNTVFALTGNDFGLGSDIVRSGFLRSRVYRPTSTHYRLYNLITGKQVLYVGIRSYESSYSDSEPKIMFFGNYMTYDTDVYELKANGALKKSKIDFHKLMDNVAMLINLDYDYKEISRDFWFWKNFNFFWSNETLDKYLTDINLMLKDVPDNLRIRNKTGTFIWKYGDDWIKEIDFSKCFPLNRDKIHPLLRKNWLYEIEFDDRQGKRYVGLYNPSENIWAIPPVDIDWFDHFYQTSYDDWIGVNNFGFERPFFNIKTRKKYMYLYSTSSARPNTMYYLGHFLKEKNDFEEVVIEDF